MNNFRMNSCTELRKADQKLYGLLCSAKKKKKYSLDNPAHVVQFQKIRGRSHTVQKMMKFTSKVKPKKKSPPPSHGLRDNISIAQRLQSKQQAKSITELPFILFI